MKHVHTLFGIPNDIAVLVLAGLLLLAGGLVALGVVLDRRRRERRWQAVRERRSRLTYTPPAGEGDSHDEAVQLQSAASTAGLVELTGTIEAFPVFVPAQASLQEPAPRVPALASVHEMYAHRVHASTVAPPPSAATTTVISTLAHVGGIIQEG